MIATPTRLAGLSVVERTRHVDARGWFGRLFDREALCGVGFPGSVAQVNQSVTRERGTVRGLHFQHAPHGETKLVSCLRGEVWDVAVDLRAASVTRGEWHAQVLSAANARALLIPRGFAHGYQALSDDAELLYVHSHAHVPAAEGGFSVTDPTLAIAWPLPIRHLSPRDAALPELPVDFAGLA